MGGVGDHFTREICSSSSFILTLGFRCRDDEIVGVGFHWDRSDELKMLDSFDKGRKDLFSHFVDVRIQVIFIQFIERSTG